MLQRISLAAAGFLYLFSLTPYSSYSFVVIWYVCFGTWAIFNLYLSFKYPNREAWFLTWLIGFLIFPKRDPNQNFVSLLNFSYPHCAIPVVEAILLVLAASAFVATTRRTSSPLPEHFLCKPCQCIGWGFVFVAIAGAIMNIVNFLSDDLYYDLAVFSVAWGRVLRSLTEGLAILAMTKLDWDKALARRLYKIVLFGMTIAIVEFGLWALRILPASAHQFLSDFRGGFRSAAHGYGGGLMMIQVWLFFIAICFLFSRNVLFLIVAMIGTAAAVMSYHRTAAFSVGLMSLILLACRWPRRTLVFGVFTAVLGTVGPGHSAIKNFFSHISERKGNEYWSLESMRSRLDIAEVSMLALKQSPFLGIGENALTANVVHGIINHSEPDNDFINLVAKEFWTVQSGQRQFDSHNLCVSLVTESGIAGLWVVGGLLWLGLRTFRIAMRNAVAPRFFPAILWTAFMLSYISMAEPYILSLLCLAILAWPDLSARTVAGWKTSGQV